jgi:hypothetical protein
VFLTDRKGTLTADMVRKLICGPVRRQSWAFQSILTCCATPAATSSPTTGTTPARSSTISGQEYPAHGAATPRWRRIASRTSGEIRSSRRTHHLRWKASKLGLPKYGDCLSAEVSGPDGTPLKLYQMDWDGLIKRVTGQPVTETGSPQEAAAGAE